MKQNTVLFWTVLGIGVAAGSAIIVRRPDSNVRQKLNETARSFKGWATPVVKELVSAKSDAYTLLQSELVALRGQIHDVRALVTEQLNTARDLKEQAQLGLYSAQYKAESIKDKVVQGVHDVQDTATALKDQVQDRIHSVQDGIRAVQEGVHSVQGTAVALKEEAQLGIYAAQYKAEAIKGQLAEGVRDAQDTASAMQSQVQELKNQLDVVRDQGSSTREQPKVKVVARMEEDELKAKSIN